jgi:hypothetical protein
VTQLVGSSCAKCRERISSIVEGRFCQECGNPIHNACNSMPSRKEDCTTCGCEKKDPTCLDASTRNNAELPQLKITAHGVLSTWRLLQMLIGGTVVVGAGIVMILNDAGLYGIFLICVGIALFGFGIWVTFKASQ